MKYKLLDEANNLFKVRKFLKAKSVYLSLVELDSSNSFLYYRLGLIFKELHDFESSLDYFEKAINILPNDEAARLQKATLLMNMKKWDKAINCFEKLIEQKTTNPAIFYRLALTLKAIGDTKGTLSLYEKTLSFIQNRDANTQIHCGLVYMALQRYSESHECWREVRESDPGNNIGYMKGAEAFLHEGLPDNAALVLLECNSFACKNKLFDILEQLKDKIVYARVLNSLAQEKFNFKEITIITERMKHLYFMNKNLYEKYFSFFKECSFLDYYTKLSLGIDRNPSVEYITQVMMTGDINLIKNIGSHVSHANSHKFNLLKIYADKLYLKCPNLYVKNIYIERGQKYNRFLPSENNDKLKIAVLVSGQARGYMEALKTHEQFNFLHHQVDYYCSLWDEVGVKKIELNSLNLKFKECFSDCFRKFSESLSYSDVEKKFSLLFEYFSDNKYLTEKQISDFYSAKKVAIVKHNDFKDKDNMYKMHYMIENAFNLIENPNQYDIMIRIRPEKELLEFNINWNELYDYLDENTVLSNDAIKIHNRAGYFMDDQFAIAKPQAMSVYSKTFSKVLARDIVFKEIDYKFKGHSSLVLSLIDTNIKTVDIKNKIKFGKLFSSKKITGSELNEIVRKSLSSDPVWMNRFLEAIKKDEESTKYT